MKKTFDRVPVTVSLMTKVRTEFVKSNLLPWRTIDEELEKVTSKMDRII